MTAGTAETQDAVANHRRSRLVAVSNRLPVVLERDEEGGWRTRPGSGGLITAMAPALRNRGGLWIGWPGTDEDADLTEVMAQASKEAGYRLVPVNLSADEVRHFYYGFANETLWPLFHDLPTQTLYDPVGWQAFQSANRRYAETVQARVSPDDFIWVHDYHLMGVARELRSLGAQQRLGFFLHIPFPPLDIFLKLPWRAQILTALLDYDLIGLQTMRDRRNFLSCARSLLPGFRTHGTGSVLTADLRDRTLRVGTFPIGIEFEEFARPANSPAITARAADLRSDLGGTAVILGVDRLDYTKGIPERLRGFRCALQRYPELRGNLTFVQLAVPSRQGVPKYRALRAEIDRLVGQINGEFTEPGWIPIHYFYRSFDRDELLAYYRAADIALVTPLKDGMNLVAKEYCASQVDNRGVLVLSEFAGAAAQLHRWALMVNPHDSEGLADGIFRAFVMSPKERRRRMSRLRGSIQRNDIFRWVDDFLEAALSRQLADFPHQEDYVPPLEVDETS